MRKALPVFRLPHAAILISASLSINLLALALPIMTMQIYDRVMVNQASETLLILSLGVLTSAFMEFLLRAMRNGVVSITGADFEHLASVEALRHVLETEPQKLRNVPTAILAQDVSAASRLKDYYGGQVAATLLVDAPFAVILLALTFYLTGELAFVSLMVLAVFGVLSWRQGLSLKHWMAVREKQDNRRYNFITEALQSVHTIKALCLEAQVTRRFEQVQHESGRANFQIGSIQGETITLSYISAQFMTVSLVAIGAPMVVAGQLTIGMLVASVMLSGQIMQPLQRGLSLWIRYQDITIARRRLSALLNLPLRSYHSEDELGANHGGIKLEQVRFAYGNDEAVLGNISLDIAPGEVVAIQGASGSGKTTLLELMAGLYEPQRGTITTGGMEPWRIPPEHRARFIAYLPNKGMILRGNIMENLSGFDTKHIAGTRNMAELLGIEEAVALLPAGYDTPVEGLSSDVISPGLKQRLSMARALMLRPRLILYDNADQGLDRDSYSSIFSLLARLKGKATLVLVSEDKNILSLADRILELRHGQLVPVMEPAAPLVMPRINMLHPIAAGAAS